MVRGAVCTSLENVLGDSGQPRRDSTVGFHLYEAAAAVELREADSRFGFWAGGGGIGGYCIMGVGFLLA